MIITSQLTPDVLLREQRPRRRCPARCSTRTWVPTRPAATAARSTAAYPALCPARPRTPHRWPTSPRKPLRDCATDRCSARAQQFIACGRMYPDFVWGVVDSKTAHTQKAFARLGYCASYATPLVVVCGRSLAKPKRVTRQCWIHGGRRSQDGWRHLERGVSL